MWRLNFSFTQATSRDYRLRSRREQKRKVPARPPQRARCGQLPIRPMSHWPALTHLPNAYFHQLKEYRKPSWPCHRELMGSVCQGVPVGFLN